jgi:hypothetical protein
MARAQRPQRALPAPRACERPEHSGGPGRRKNLERRLRRAREEGRLPAGEILLPDGLWAASAGSSALQSRQGRFAEPPRKVTVARSLEDRKQRQVPPPLSDPLAAGVSPVRQEPATTAIGQSTIGRGQAGRPVVARASEKRRTFEGGPPGPTDGLLHLPARRQTKTAPHVIAIEVRPKTGRPGRSPRRDQMIAKADDNRRCARGRSLRAETPVRRLGSRGTGARAYPVRALNRVNFRRGLLPSCRSWARRETAGAGDLRSFPVCPT